MSDDDELFQVTLLVHTREKRVYDPLIGQFLTPDWTEVEKNVQTPEKVHLYRFNGNDPINPSQSAPSFGMRAEWMDWIKTTTSIACLETNTAYISF